MSNIERIRQKLDQLYDGEVPKHDQQCNFDDGYFMGLATISYFIDSLPEENNPEPYNPVYDEDYLNEKIAKATKSWEGVDVDKMLADCRGYEEKPSEELEEAAEEYAIPFNDTTHGCEYSYKGFIAGAEWQEKQDLKWAGEIHKNGYNLCKEQMMKDAVEGKVFMSFAPGHERMVMADVDLPTNTKVKLIIVKED